MRGVLDKTADKAVRRYVNNYEKLLEQTFVSVPGRQECLPYQIFLFRDKLLTNTIFLIVSIRAFVNKKSDEFNN